MDHLPIMGFLLLLFTTLSAVQFAEARVLEHHLPNVDNNSAVTFDSDLDAVAVASSRQNYSGPEGHVANYSESNPGISSENSTHADNNTIITVELLQKEATPGDGRSRSKALAGNEEAAPIDSNADTLHEMLNSHTSTGIGHTGVNGRSEGNILSSGQSPGVGHWKKSKTKYSTSPARTTPNNVLSSGPSPGVGNGHTSAISGTQSELGTSFNKLPSGPSPGVGHKVTNGYIDQMAQQSESKKSAMIMDILPSGSSPGVGNSATNGRNMMETMSIESESKKKTAFTQKSELKKKSATMMNIMPSGPSPGVGNSATNGRNTMEKIMSKEDDQEGMSIHTFNRLPSGPSPGVGHAYPNNHQPENIQTVSEDRKVSDHIPLFHKLPGGPSPGGGNSHVEKSASTVRIQLSSNAVIKSSWSPSPRDGNSSMNKFKLTSGSQTKVEQTGGAPDLKIGCDGVGLDFYITPSPPMFGIAAVERLRSKF